MFYNGATNGNVYARDDRADNNRLQYWNHMPVYDRQESWAQSLCCSKSLPFFAFSFFLLEKVNLLRKRVGRLYLETPDTQK
jgi:hypothetical protein